MKSFNLYGIENLKRIFILTLFFIFSLFTLHSANFTFTANIVDQPLTVEKTLFICYESPLHAYNCYKASDFPYLTSYSNGRVEFRDPYNGFNVVLDYSIINQFGEFKYRAFSDNTISITTSYIYFYSLIYVPKDKVYSFYYNEKLATFYETSNYYIVPLSSDGVLKIIPLISNSSKNSVVIEARFLGSENSLVCVRTENLDYCCDTSNISNCNGFYIPLYEKLKININNVSVFIDGLNKVGEKVNIELLDKSDPLVEKYVITINSTDNLSEINILWPNFNNLFYYIYKNGNKELCNNVVVNTLTYCSIQLLNPGLLSEIIIERINELPVVVIKRGSTIFTNSSDKLEAYYYPEENKVELIDKIEGLTLVLENVSFNLSKEIPEVELYVIEKTNNKTIVKASVLRGFNYSKAYLQLNVPGRVKQIIKDNGTSSIIWRIFSFIGGKLIIEFTEQDPIFYIDHGNIYENNKKNNGIFLGKELGRYSYLSLYVLPLPINLQTFIILTDPYSTQPTKVSLFNLFYLAFGLIGFLVYYFFFERVGSKNMNK